MSFSKTTITLLIKYAVCTSLYINVISCTFNSNETFVFGSTTLAIQDFVCQGNGVLGNVTGISDLHCAYTCSNDPSCRSFFHHQGDDICVTCSENFDETSSLIAYTGMKYYRIPDQSLWNPWGSWSSCTKTCGTGTKTRTRTCHQDTPVPCTGDALNIEQCNSFDCLPYAKTCAEWASKGLNSSVYVQIDPLGTGLITVFCNFDFEPGKVITVLDHDQRDTKHVNGYGTCATFSVNVNYDVGLDIAKEIVDISTGCKQFVEWRCKGSRLFGCTYWETRHGNRSTYFTGSPPPGRYCACGDTNSCEGSETHCNCDNNDIVWREDEGYVTSKNDLPITGYKAGDTGAGVEEGYMTIGQLLCY